ncbi:MAG: transketolase [Clostridia bacterium]|nr:transketolase [Clostridia bacterium]
MELQALKAQCRVIRRDIISMLAGAGSGHPGGSLSAVEILAALYGYKMNVDAANPSMPERDRFVLSKGHAAPALYAVLANNGFFDKEEYTHLRKMGGMLQGHPDKNKCPGVDASTGSLGQGVSVAVGMALGIKTMHGNQHVYTLLGDGESQEGMVWEALMAAAHYKLDNLTVIFDWNGLQIDGRNDDVMSLGDFPAKLRAFGLDLIEVQDGNDLEQVIAALDEPACPGKPRCILCHTVKGKGVSFMENQAGWHGKAPKAEEAAIALKELED